jgi:SAM-dependent methyltransferase
MHDRKQRRRARCGEAYTTWEPVASWYDGWVGAAGGRYHRAVVIPTVVDLLALRPGERVLDLGAGQGVLAPAVAARGGRYVGIEASPRLVAHARRRHGRAGSFVEGDVRHLRTSGAVGPRSFDKAVFVLSIQNMEPLHPAVRSVAWALRPGGALVLLMTHPCFRVPRMSGWGWDAGRKIRYRRIDRYLSPVAVSKAVESGAERGTTFDFHRPLEEYVTALSRSGLLIDALREIPARLGRDRRGRGRGPPHENPEIPLFLALRGIKRTDEGDRDPHGSCPRWSSSAIRTTCGTTRSRTTRSSEENCR